MPSLAKPEAEAPSSKPSLGKRLAAALGWNRTSYYMMSVFALLLFLMGYVWWPLILEYFSTYNPDYPFWMQIDWLLFGNFAFMSLLMMSGADLKRDALVVGVGLVGGLVIESWGTQTNLWTYYTDERPPLWIIPAWPIASLAIDRLYRLMDRGLRRIAAQLHQDVFPVLYWMIFLTFYALMLVFIWPTRGLSLTVMALVLCAFLTLTPTDYRVAVLTFAAGSGLGYFLELWGTTRQCWIYYTLETPPLFAVLAHGMAAVAFWRVAHLFRIFQPRLRKLIPQRSEG